MDGVKNNDRMATHTLNALKHPFKVTDGVVTITSGIRVIDFSLKELDDSIDNGILTIDCAMKKGYCSRVSAAECAPNGSICNDRWNDDLYPSWMNSNTTIPRFQYK